jgi:16S rRNA G966 N2-methylase RsmD
MRIIAGEYRSRRLEAPAGLATRPTSDRLRETLFNVLTPRMEGAVFLDLYAGSGAVGMEALSRGAKSVDFVERADAAVAVLRGNLARLGIRDGVRVHTSGVGVWLRRITRSVAAPPHGRGPVRGDPGPDRKPGLPKAFDLVFLDPPYEAVEEYAATLGVLGGSVGLLAPGALVIAEHRRKEKLGERYGELGRTRLLEQGDAALSFYAASPEA